MADRSGKAADFSSVAAALAGTASSAALRRVRGFAEAAPSSRLFGAIATLTELSRGIESRLDEGAAAMAMGDDESAALHFTRAIVRIDELAASASPGKPSGGLPDYLRKRR